MFSDYWERMLEQMGRLMNALQMQHAGGGICLDETNLSAAVLATRLMQLLETPKILSNMAKSARSLASPNAANLIAAMAENLMAAAPTKHRGAAA